MSLAARVKNDVRFLLGVGKALARVTPMARDKARTFPQVAEELARRHGERTAFLSERETLTFAEYNGHANRYARWALREGVKKGDTVCLLMPNRPEYLAIWLGIARVGGVVALLNTNLVGGALAYCINIVRPKHIIVAAELATAFEGAKARLEVDPAVWWFGGEGSDHRLDVATAKLDDGQIPENERPALTHEDRCLYIYTSGTTGLPKAANINHFRVLAAMLAFSSVMGATRRDRMYNCLPLYHTVGGIIAAGACLMAGGSCFIREKFSASQFWDDVVDQDCTLFQYVGELCRYLVNAPPHPKEGRHRVRLCCGNGLRPDIWPTFKARFRIPHIREFYAATEGNAVLFNFDDRQGAVGRIPHWAERAFPLSIVRLGLDSGVPLRNSEGFCEPCADGEVGELVSRIVVDPLKPAQRFDGYSDRAATEAKILRDAFEIGDVWFRSGDLMMRDARGYYFFVDRMGDTFRWKGENVATSEVAETIMLFPGVHEANVYGVRVEHAEGRAGMAAIVADESLDLEALRAYLHQHLSSFARPLFLRFQGEIEHTSTFKQRKVDLARQGFDPVATDDSIFFDNPETGCYVRLDAGLFRRIQGGEIRI